MNKPPDSGVAISGQMSGTDFTTTHWSMVIAAGDSSPAALPALQKLCAAYWYPLYAYVRRQGHGVEDAEDLTQEFFARMLERRYFRLADRNRGRFRTFLLTSLKHFLINEWAKANREKRGGGQKLLSIDDSKMETRFRAEPVAQQPPDKVYERQWALVLLERVLNQLQSELVGEGRGEWFEELKPFLTGIEEASSCAEASRRMGITEGTLRVRVYRLRQRYRELLKKEVSQTVEDSALVEEEIRHLISALSD